MAEPEKGILIIIVRPTLREKYGNDVPLLFINGCKAFKIRVTVKEFREVEEGHGKRKLTKAV